MPETKIPVVLLVVEELVHRLGLQHEEVVPWEVLLLEAVALVKVLVQELVLVLAMISESPVAASAVSEAVPWAVRLPW